ncbi:MAG: HIT family protein, partial [Pseudomonadota bacterium]
MAWVLDPTLARDTLAVASLSLSELLLMNDARYPWCILVPRRADVTEWHHLDSKDQQALNREISAVSPVLAAQPEVQKLNVGALGNRVRQLHVHIVGRHAGDPAWPDPVWGFG